MAGALYGTHIEGNDDSCNLGLEEKQEQRQTRGEEEQEKRRECKRTKAKRKIGQRELQGGIAREAQEHSHEQ